MAGGSSTLYLEHYLDSLESLPGDLRRNFTLMHDLDRKNRTILQEADALADEYLSKVRDLTSSDRKVEMEKIQSRFGKAKIHGDDKVAIAIQTYELVDKHIRRLDADLAKFEAEMKEKGRLSQTETETEAEAETGPKSKAKKKYTKTAGSKANAGSAGGGTSKKGGKKDEEKGGKRGKKKAAGGSGGHADKSATPKEPLLGGASLAASVGIPQEVLDMPVDPNEPTYCLCQQVSYGEMIGCDNSDCPIEWFHFGCMGLTTKPKGKWYCPKCVPLYKKKK
ncbi:hypothetical protein TCAL_07622 [Tigriopus californicus]|uniref:Inhibitor of growth protein n=1 Tax=Tigriopus californicus TaxID=6832 RepID=A0A553NVV0_TIGCA|nr:inhibitor of growth protein 5-like [Tigriopus californicus]TRY69549.1 hypothetical protein TCAL_07622 [Tigriopus californicus]|eukprot:TCALIF_07622-PA protein Name:"Similar to ING4 Inhibitor of growth protein 4 (Homo sapiens)" AED:0.00 eAED:0.00 QI:0/-1/0/1/-1/1/1/0/278